MITTGNEAFLDDGRKVRVLVEGNSATIEVTADGRTKTDRIDIEIFNAIVTLGITQLTKS